MDTTDLLPLEMCRGLWKRMTKWSAQENMKWVCEGIGNNISLLINNNNNNLMEMIMRIEIDRFEGG